MIWDRFDDAMDDLDDEERSIERRVKHLQDEMGDMNVEVPAFDWKPTSGQIGPSEIYEDRQSRMLALQAYADSLSKLLATANESQVTEEFILSAADKKRLKKACRDLGKDVELSPRFHSDKVLATFEQIRRHAATRTGEFRGNNAYSRKEVHRVNGVKLEILETDEIEASISYEKKKVWISNGLLKAIDARAKTIPETDRDNFRSYTLILLFAQTLANFWAISETKYLVTEALRALRGGYVFMPGDFVRQLNHAFSDAPGKQLLVNRIRSYVLREWASK